jgi:hypothetical protein
MSALIQSRISKPKSISRLLMLVAIGAKGYKGGQAVVNSAGYVVNGASGPGNVKVGYFYEDFDNSAGSVPLAVNIELDQEIWVRWLANDTTAPITQADMLRDAYVLDDQTATADSNNTIAGRVWGIDTKLGVLTQCTFAQGSADTSQSLVHDVRGVITSIASYVAAAGVLTASATGAIGAQDGITLAAGDLVLLPTDKAATASDAGPYIVTSPGGTGVKFVLTRPDWYRSGSHQTSGQIITVRAEGTKYGGSEWKSLVAASTFVVDTTDGVFYPRLQTSAESVAMISGVLATPITALYVAPNAIAIAEYVTKGGTVGPLKVSTQTAGVPGSSSLVATSEVTTDTSTVKFKVVNF